MASFVEDERGESWISLFVVLIVGVSVGVMKVMRLFIGARICVVD
jgi:hypothetical protein